MAKSRSPNYPAFGLPKALSLVQRVYDKEHLHKAEPAVIVKAMGYSSMNGASLTTISSLKKYGLLVESGDGLKVSEDALTMLVDPPGSVARAEATRKAAFTPVLFAELKKQYGESPPSDENLRSFLLKKGFLQSAVDVPIRAYRETLQLVSNLPKVENEAQAPNWEEDTTMDSGSSAKPEVKEGKPPLNERRNDPPPPPPRGKQVGSEIPVTKNCSMSVMATGEVTQEGLEKLVQYINLIKGSFPSTDETIQ